MSPTPAAPPFIPLADLDYGPEEAAAVQRVLASRWLTMGPETAAFEDEFAARLGARHAVSVCNGTAALHLALLAAGVQPGDEVIVPSLTFVATANAVRACGARAVFADVCSLEDWTLDPADVARRIGARTRALLAMHYGGFACRMPELVALCRTRGLLLLEDAAHAPGASLEGRMLGTFGAAGCFSFFSNKNLATGEGGMLVTDQDAVAEQARLLRSHGLSSSTSERHQGRALDYDALVVGHNYRLDELRSALGRVQLGKLEAGNRRRGALCAAYHRQLADVDGVQLPFRAHRGVSAHHLLPVLVPAERRDEIRREMRRRGVQTSVHYRPVHTLAAYRGLDPQARLPTTEEIGRREISLPLFPGLAEAQVAEVAGALADSLRAQPSPG